MNEKLTADEYEFVYNENNKSSQFETSIDRYDQVMQQRKSSDTFKEYLTKNAKPLTNKEIQMLIDNIKDQKELT